MKIMQARMRGECPEGQWAPADICVPMPPEQVNQRPHPLGENLTKAEQICQDKMNSMTWTSEREIANAKSLYSECVRNATTPKRYSKLETSYKELKKALPWIIGVGVIVFIMYKNK